MPTYCGYINTNRIVNSILARLSLLSLPPFDIIPGIWIVSCAVQRTGGDEELINSLVSEFDEEELNKNATANLLFIG